MILKDRLGNEVEVEIYGKYEDDLQISSAEYIDERLGEVDDHTIDYLLNTYYEEIYEAWFDKQISNAEYAFEGER